MEPPSDPYGARQLVLSAHIGTLYDKTADLIATVCKQRQRIDELEALLIEALTLHETRLDDLEAKPT